MKELKPWTSVDAQLRQLNDRGMDVTWPNSEHWLRAVGYYRLSGYWHPFRQRSSEGVVSSLFRQGTTFEAVANLYEFDRKLKAHLLSGLERVEIACRSRIGDVLGARSVNALMEPGHFRSAGQHQELVDIIHRRIARAIDSNDAAALHHQSTYGSSYPVWAAMEFLDFGDVSRLYANLLDDDREEVARWFGWGPSHRHPEANFGAALMNWLHHLTIVRNTAAHHARLWNRTFEPTSTKRLNLVPALKELRGQQDHLYGTIVVLSQLVRAASPGTTWTQRLEDLLDRSFGPIPGVSWSQLGFPEDWRTRAPFTLATNML